MKKYLISFIIFSITSGAIAHAPADSSGNQVASKEPVTAAAPTEQNYFDFLRMLHAEQPQKTGNFGRS